MALDLTGVTLLDFDLVTCRVRRAGFNYALFIGDAFFHPAEFTSGDSFWGARFSGNARFEHTQFVGMALFGEVEFAGNAWFSEERFTVRARLRLGRRAGSRGALIATGLRSLERVKISTLPSSLPEVNHNGR